MSTAQSLNPHKFVIVDIQIDPQALTLTASDGTSISIQQKPMEVLQFLVQQYPALVTREQLIQNVWAGNHYVGEKALTNAIWQLRHHFQQLGLPDFIGTVRKKGYRLSQQPHYLSSEVPAAFAGPASVDTPSATMAAPISLKPKSVLWIASFLLLFVLAGGLGLFYIDPWSTPASKEVKLTQGSGHALFPSLSDDNRYLAFTWRKFEQSSDLYLLDLHSKEQKFKQLTFSPDNEHRPIWGRDQRYLYYSSTTAVYGLCQIMRLDLRSLQSKKLANCSRHSTVYMDISPDGRYLLFNGSVTEDGRSLYQLDLHNSEAEAVALACRQNCAYRVRDLAFSPDGEYLALTRRSNALSEQIYLHHLPTGEEVQLTDSEEDIIGMEWHPDGKRLVYGAFKQGKRTAILLDVQSQKRQDLGVADFAGHSRITAEGELFFHRLNSASQLAYLPLQPGIAGALFPLTASDERYESPDYSEKRQAMVYVSNESGYMELWMADPDMQNRRQLTQLHGVVRSPRWSHDGQKVVFVARFAGEEHDRLTVLDTSTGQLSILATGLNWHRRPGWWQDDSAVIFTHGSVLYRYDLASHAISQLTREHGIFSRMSKSGQFYFTKGTNQGLWLLQADGSERQILTGKQFSTKYAWTLVGEDIYFLHQQPHQLLLRRFQAGSTSVQDLQRLPNEQLFPTNTLSYDPQRQRLLLELAALPRADIIKLSHPLLQ